MKISEVDGRLASIDSNLASLGLRLTDHTSQDETSFSNLSIQVGALDEKLDQLLLREATREGERDGVRRSVIALASIISVAVNGIGMAIMLYVG
jgi:hypothetical protein